VKDGDPFGKPPVIQQITIKNKFKEMKKLIQTPVMLAMLLLFTATSCKKDDIKNDDPLSQFDINDPVGYFIYVKTVDGDGNWASPGLLEFRPGQAMKIYDVSLQGYSYPLYKYEKTSSNTIKVTNLNYEFVIENGKVTSKDARFKELVLIKHAETNQLSGKTFAGTYYRPDNSILHQSFFYSYAESSFTAGYKVGAAVRMETYSSIGNIASWSRVSGTKDVEFMVLVNGKLEAGYNQDQPLQRYYGSFTQQ
jgi:hypothetical protein